MRVKSGKKRYAYEVVPALIFGGVVILIMAFSVIAKIKQGEDWLVYAESLDMPAASVNGQEITLRDMAFYIAYDEMVVEEQAQIYDSGDTTRYWNLKTNDVYIRQLSKQNVMKKAIHDEIFYQMALQEGIELSQEDEQRLLDVQETYMDNIMDSSKLERMGITEEDVSQTIFKIGMAQKYQSLYAEINHIEMQDLEIEGEAYEMMLADNTYKINRNVWDRVNYGDVTLVHKNGVFQTE